MLWDDGFSSWRALKIPGQPAAILFAPDGFEFADGVGEGTHIKAGQALMRLPAEARVAQAAE